MLSKADFPIFQRTVHNCRLAYLDSAATTQKPQSVLDAISNYYKSNNANVHRGLHQLSVEATAAYEQGRVKLGNWINAAHPEREIVFTKGATEALNLAAHAIGASLNPGDEILISALEHHANLIPWQQLAQTKGVILKQIPITTDGALDQDAYRELLSAKTRVVAVNAMSNALGTINPIAEMAKQAHGYGALLVCDATQMAPHFKIDVLAMGCDVLVMSGHKMYGPTGIGLCYASAELLASWPPYQTGGEMIDQVQFATATYKEPPYRFEAGTPNIAGVVGWAAAIDYLAPRISELAQHELQLVTALDQGLDAIPGVRRYSCAPDKTAIAAFTVEGCHPQDLAVLLDTFGVAVRSGHHCVMPLMQILGVVGLLRVSLAAYSDMADVEQFLQALPKVQAMCVGV